MANMTFKANLLPSSDLGYSLGSSTQQWKINGSSLGTAAFKNESGTWAISISGSSASCTGNAATATKISSTPNNTTTFLRGDNTWSNKLTGDIIIGTPGTRNVVAFYGSGNGNYTQAIIGASQTDGFLIETPRSTDESSGTILACNIKSRGGSWAPLNSGKITINNNAILQMNSESTSVDSWINFYDGSENTYIGIRRPLNNYGATYRRGSSYYTIFHEGNYTSWVPSKTGSGASGTWGISITGNAATATQLASAGNTSQFYRGDRSWSNYLTSGIFLGGGCPLTFYGNGTGTYNLSVMYCDNRGLTFETPRASDSGSATPLEFRVCTRGGQYTTLRAGAVYGAVWNDYAEYRETKEKIEPGRCIVETGKGDLILSSSRLQEGCEIVSDTFGFAIGESKKCKTPTTASGRVLAYLLEDNNKARPGQPVCSGPNGTVSLMTNEEARKYPWCIIGTISELPDYDIWYAGSDNDISIKVNGRVWIRIR